MSNLGNLSNEEVTKMKDEIRKCISLYILNNKKDEENKTSNKDNLVSQIIEIISAYELLKYYLPSFSPNSGIYEICSTISNESNAEFVTNQIYSLLENSYHNFEHVIEEAIENNITIENEQDWDQEL